MLKNAARASEVKLGLLNRIRRGQSMVEYSVVTHAILLGGVLSGAAPILPGSVSIVGMLFSAITDYYKSIYAVLCASTL